MHPLLSVAGLRTGYIPPREVLRGVSLDVGEGEFVGLVGPNGSGKTTLVRAATRSLKPYTGQVSLRGTDIWSLHAREFARVAAVVPQETAVSFDMTCLDVVLLGRHPHVGRLHLEGAADESVALESMRVVGAEHLADRSILQVSGGERQRVIIAKALAQEPKLLFLDEPTAHLDVANQTEVLSLVSRLAAERGMAVIAVLHDLNLAAAWCRRIAVLHQGAIAADGSPEEVITEPLVSRVWSARMWVRRNPLTGRPFLLPMPPPYELEERSGPLVHVVCGGGSGGPVLSALMQEGFRVTCGVVNVGDSDEEICRAMNIPHVAEAPFSPISRERADANRKMALAADAIVLTDFCVGSGNVDNLRMVDEAAAAGRVVVHLSAPDGGGLDYTGGEGEHLLQRIHACSEAAGTVEQMLTHLRQLRNGVP